MNEMDLLTRLMDEVPREVGAPKAERALMAAIRSELRAPRPAAGGCAAGMFGLRLRCRWLTREAGVPRRHAGGRAWRPAVAMGLAVAAAAGLIAVQAVVPGGAPAARAALTPGKLAKLAAARALLQSAVRPGQWVYWEKDLTSPPFMSASSPPSGVFRVWTTGSAGKAAYYTPRGHLKLARCSRANDFFNGICSSLGGQAYAARVSIHRRWWETPLYEWPPIPVSYRQLGSLPRTPRMLLRYLARLGYGPGGAPTRQFTLVDYLLTTYVTPPPLTAELYRALGEIRGVTVDPHAVDLAGRPGVGFQIIAGAARYEIILNPHSYLLMGDGAFADHQLLNGEAILRRALVSGPGVRP